MGKTVAVHTTVSGYDENDNFQSVTLAPGDELPEWAPESAVNNEKLFAEDDELVAAEDEETGTQVLRSEVTPEDHTSPTFGAGYEGGTAEATEAQKDEERAASDYANMNKDQLSALLEERQLPKSGSRQELIERLEQSDAENG
jgi:SAP domain-containing protein